MPVLPLSLLIASASEERSVVSVTRAEILALLVEVVLLSAPYKSNAIEPEADTVPRQGTV